MKSTDEVYAQIRFLVDRKLLHIAQTRAQLDRDEARYRRFLDRDSVEKLHAIHRAYVEGGCRHPENDESFEFLYELVTFLGRNPFAD